MDATLDININATASVEAWRVGYFTNAACFAILFVICGVQLGRVVRYSQTSRWTLQKIFHVLLCVSLLSTSHIPMMYITFARVWLAYATET